MDNRRPTFFDSLNAGFGNPMTQFGLNLLAGSARGDVGGGITAGAQAAGRANEVDQRRRLLMQQHEEEQARLNQAQAEKAQQQKLFLESITQADPKMQPILRMLGPQKAGEFLLKQMQGPEQMSQLEQARMKLIEAQTGQISNSSQNKIDAEERAHARAKELLEMRLEEGKREGAKYGLTPIYGRDAQGNPVLLQTGTQGEVIRSNIPEGITVDPGLAPELQSRGRAVGKGQGEAEVNLPMMEHEAATIKEQIDTVLDDSYLPSMTGWQQALPNITPRAKTTQARLDQLSGKAFLIAFEKLKGAGQITEREGARAEAALTRLSELGQEDEAYSQALKEFKKEIGALVEVARRKAGVGTPPQRKFRVIGTE